MKALPLTVGTIHFVGIGGIGMSGIAEILNNLGYSVQGSDLAENANVKRLRDLGIAVSIGQTADNLGSAEVLVISSAVKPDNPEVVAARARHIPLRELAGRLNEIGKFKEKPVIVTGAGPRAGAACRLLRHSGFNNVFQLKGGIAAWQQASLPVEK